MLTILNNNASFRISASQIKCTDNSMQRNLDDFNSLVNFPSVHIRICVFVCFLWGTNLHTNPSVTGGEEAVQFFYYYYIIIWVCVMERWILLILIWLIA